MWMMLAQSGAEAVHHGSPLGFLALAVFGAGIGAGLVAIAAGYGISRIAAASVEAMARQPEVAGKVNTAMIISAALIEGVSFFAALACFQCVGNVETWIKAALAASGAGH